MSAWPSAATEGDRDREFSPYTRSFGRTAHAGVCRAVPLNPAPSPEVERPNNCSVLSLRTFSLGVVLPGLPGCKCPVKKSPGDTDLCGRVHSKFGAQLAMGVARRSAADWRRCGLVLLALA